MNAYTKAQQLLALIVAEALPKEPDYSLPTNQYARVGTAVVSCASVQVAALDMQTEGAALGVLTVDCNDAIQLSSFACIISRDCGWEANEDGSDNLEAVAAVSAMGAEDADFLWTWANNYDEYISKAFSVGWSITGGILITTLTLTTGID